MAKARTLALRVQADIAGVDQIASVGKRLSTVGKDLTKNYTLPILAAGAAAFKFASDVDEASGRAAKVFEEDASRIQSAAQSMDDAFSEAAFLDEASGFGAILQQIGFVEDAAADLSLAWLDLAQDMASFHDTKPEEAIGAIRSALAGEFEPLKRYGVFLNETIVRQKAMAQGLFDGVGAIDAQTRALIVNQELFSQQPKILGDFERTSGNAANATRILLANFTDMAATLGKELLPLGTELLRTVNGWVKGFKDLSPEAQTWIVRLAGIVAATGPVLFVFGKLLSSIKLFVGAGKLVRDAWRNIPTALGFVDLALSKIGPAFDAAVAAARRGFGSLRTLSGAFGALGVAAAAAFADQFHDEISRSGADLSEALFPDGAPLEGLGDFVEDLPWPLGPKGAPDWAKFSSDVEEGVEDINGAVERGLQGIPITADREFEAFTDVTYQHLLAAKGVVDEGVAGMADELGGMPEKAADELLANQFHLTDAIDELINFMDQALTPAEEVFNARMFLASQAAADGLASGNPLVRQKTQEMVDAANAVLAQFGKSAFNYGYNFGASYAAGVVNSLGLVRDAGRQLGGALANQVRIESEPPDHTSPLYGITKWGGNIAKTYAAGILRELGAVSSASRALAGAVGLGGLAGIGSMRPSAVPAAGGGGGITNIYNNFTFTGTATGGDNELSGLLQRLTAVSGGAVRYG